MMRQVTFLTLVSLCAGITGCGQGEPDRYKTKGTERPSKSVPTAETKEKQDGKGSTPAKNDSADKSKEAKAAK